VDVYTAENFNADVTHRPF